MTSNKTFINLIPWIFVALGIFFIWVGQINQKERTETTNVNTLTNQFYNRATNCFAAVTPTERTREHVEYCYDEAERETGYKGKRYTSERN